MLSFKPRTVLRVRRNFANKAKGYLLWQVSRGDLFAALPLTSRLQREAALRWLSALATQAPAEPRTVLRVRRNFANKAKGHPEVAS